MSAKIYAILTIVIVGLISFLIGWLLMSTKWKKKFFEADRIKKIFENKTKKQEQLLSRSKEELKVAKQRLLHAQADTVKLEKEIKGLHKKNISLKNQSLNYSHTDDTYNKLLNDLNLEKKKNATLKADFKRTVVNNQVSKTIPTTIGTNNNLNSNQKQFVPVNEKLPNEPLKRQTVAEGSPLFPIIQRVSIFSNLEQKDDLALMEGIDSALAARLNTVGFINFKQIAMLTEKDLNTISLEMKMKKGQAMNDNWVAQARTLYHKKYSS